MGALLGGALGDALGMPTQLLARAEIEATLGPITDFAAPRPDHPISRGLPAGAITDDTEQTLLLARLIIASPTRFDEHGWARALMDWEVGVRRRGLYDLLGPSTKRALEALANGVSESETGLGGVTNGAAMRASPVGLSTPVEPLGALVDQVEATARITHNTPSAIAAAAAIAAAISAGIDGAAPARSIALAIAAAREGERRGPAGAAAGASIADRIAAAILIEGEGGDAAFLERVETEVGSSVASEESVPAAFALFHRSPQSAWRAGLMGANIGGDSDTIAAMAAGMAGAHSGAAKLPADKLERLLSVNRLDADMLADLTTDLLAVRAERAAQPMAPGA